MKSNKMKGAQTCTFASEANMATTTTTTHITACLFVCLRLSAVCCLTSMLNAVESKKLMNGRRMEMKLMRIIIGFVRLVLARLRHNKSQHKTTAANIVKAQPSFDP